VKYFTARPSSCVFPQSIAPDSLQDLCKGSLHRFHNSIVYEYLLTPTFSFELDYVEVLLSLCDVMTELYQRFLHADCFHHGQVYDCILKFDARMKHHVINLVAKELTELASNKVRTQTQTLRSLVAL
jgi:hypothetical protein